MIRLFVTRANSRVSLHGSVALTPLAAFISRTHSHHAGGDDTDDHKFQSQSRVAGIVADVLEPLPSVALSSAPPKQGRHQTGRKRLSGIQQEILLLYRNLLREAKKFDDSESRSNITNRIRGEFREDAKIPRKLLAKIEWKLHYGRNKLEDVKAMRPNSRFRVLS